MTHRNKKLTLKHLHEKLRMKLKEMNKLKQRIQEIEIDIKEFDEEIVDDMAEKVDNLNKVQKKGKDAEIPTRSEKVGNSKDDKYTPLLKCDICETTFGKSSDLECHIKAKHEGYEDFNCELCNKKFVTLWRLTKHQQIHYDKSRKFCHYFNQDLNCPFDELGCKFLHMFSAQCKFGQFCTIKLCSYRHKRKNVINQNSKNKKFDNSTDTIEETTEIHSFCTSTPKSEFDQCEECLDKTECVDCVVKHVLRKHESLRKILF